MAARDFEYNNQDVNQLNGAFIQLVQDEKIGFWIGVGGFAYTQFIMKKFVKSTNIFASVTSLFSAAVLANLYTHQSRASYGRVAARANRNASLTLNKLMEY